MKRHRCATILSSGCGFVGDGVVGPRAQPRTASNALASRVPYPSSRASMARLSLASRVHHAQGDRVFGLAAGWAGGWAPALCGDAPLPASALLPAATLLRRRPSPQWHRQWPSPPQPPLRLQLSSLTIRSFDYAAAVAAAAARARALTRARNQAFTHARRHMHAHARTRARRHTHTYARARGRACSYPHRQVE